MKVIIVGYGQMGREIETVLNKRNHSVTLRVDAAGLGDALELNQDMLQDADAVIEFALSDGILKRITLYALAGIPVVVGTTGWEEQVGEAQSLIQKAGGTLLKGSNFSIGAHLFSRISAQAAKLIDKVDEYDAALLECHHNRKADYPSGTAISTAKGILAELGRKTHIISDLPKGGVAAPDALHVASLRVGSVPGVHELYLDSPADCITLRHEARGRGGFALGAVRGLEWLAGRKGWYEADSFIDDLLTGGNT